MTVEAVCGGEQNGVDNVILQVPEPSYALLMVAGAADFLLLRRLRSS